MLNCASPVAVKDSTGVTGIFLSLSEPHAVKPNVSATEAAIGVNLIVRFTIYFSLIAWNEYQKLV